MYLFGSFAREIFHADNNIETAVVLDGYPSKFNTLVNLMGFTVHIDTRIESFQPQIGV